MPEYSPKEDIGKFPSIKKEDMKLKHNLLDIVGETLFEGLQKGRLNPKFLEKFQADVDLDLGEGWSANLGYNQSLGPLQQDVRLALKYKIPTSSKY